MPRRAALLLCLYAAHFAAHTPAAEGVGLRARGRAAVAIAVHAAGAYPAAASGSEDEATGKAKLGPEFQAEVDKLDATQDKVREAMSVQRDSLAKRKEALRVVQKQEKDAQRKVDEVVTWLKRAQESVDKIDSQKQAVHVQFDLKRLRPLVGLAAEKKKKLIMETEKIGSAHKEVSSRVAALEAELEELQAEKSERGSGVRSGSSSESGSSSSGSGLNSSSSDGKSDGKKGATKLAPSLEALLADLTS